MRNPKGEAASFLYQRVVTREGTTLGKPIAGFVQVLDNCIAIAAQTPL
jgi:hypothetical protein